MTDKQLDHVTGGAQNAAADGGKNTAAGGVRNFIKIAGFLAGLIAGLSGEERCLSLDSDKDCVHMANLHKVKGLEAPIIILAAAVVVHCRLGIPACVWCKLRRVSWSLSS